ncbi:unnamed protein product [Caenorhabditis auriculariae]|uniref:ShKT domain-containing protein n=1 Tax=Caenorhabditis auriculariae TaxID=2777116 RepID=A0A8S1HTM3_9PELO|nr:unnamed protein product [Caenorhabditis auriculariae]
MLILLVLAVICQVVGAQGDCRDFDNNCRDWVAVNAQACTSTEYIKRSCRRSCGVCGSVDPKYDLRRLPSSLQPVAFLIGKWRSEHGGKAIFPTIPKFTFGEQVEISIPDDEVTAQKALNYTAFAWSINDRDELHSESGYISVKPNTKEVALTTVMSNGFVTVEEGPVIGNQLRLRVRDIGRISFSRDLPVHDLVREWTLLDSTTLQARLNMETLTHGMQEHTFIRYNKIAP